MIIGSGLIQSGTPAFGTLSADSSDSALLAGQDALVCVYDGANYLYFGKASGTWKTLWVDTTGGLLRGDGAGTYAVTLASDGPAPFDVAGRLPPTLKRVLSLMEHRLPMRRTVSLGGRRRRCRVAGFLFSNLGWKAPPYTGTFTSIQPEELDYRKIKQPSVDFLMVLFPAETKSLLFAME